ncbi:MAG: RNA polymerase sigma factor [Planctomycetota bacterium]
MCVGPDVKAECDVPADRDLLRQYLRLRSATAFEQLIARHERALVSLATAMVPDPDLAHEAVHDAFVKLARDAQGLMGRSRDHGSLRGWLCRVVRNGCVDRLRCERGRRFTRLMDQDPVADSDGSPGDGSLAAGERLWRAVAALPETERAAVILRYREGRSYREIGEALGKTVSHVGVLLHRALGRLRVSRTLQTEVQP